MLTSQEATHRMVKAKDRKEVTGKEAKSRSTSVSGLEVWILLPIKRKNEREQLKISFHLSNEENQ